MFSKYLFTLIACASLAPCFSYQPKLDFAPPLEVHFAEKPHIHIITSPLEINPSLAKLDIAQDTQPLIPSPLTNTHMLKVPISDMSFAKELSSNLDIQIGSEHFDIDVEYAPKRSRPGYVFKVTLLPNTDVQFKRMAQNYYFLIDRSNSIPRSRYQANKQAVAQALELLQSGDHFSILIFDGHVTRFSENLVPFSEDALLMARDFLNQQPHGGYFATTDLYTSLHKIIPQNISEKALNTAILLSDGDSYLSIEKQRKMIGGWTAHNQGKISLYTLASGKGNNLPLLDLISSFNKGTLIYAQNDEDIAERLTFLMRTLQRPLGKKLVPTVITMDNSMNVLLQPKLSRMPDLYQHRPFVIYGSTNKLSDFVLFLQGNYGDQKFDIKKTISLKNGKMSTFSVERGWTRLLAQEFYEHFFEDGDFTHLENAKQLLAPLNLPLPLLENNAYHRR